MADLPEPTHEKRAREEAEDDNKTEEPLQKKARTESPVDPWIHLYHINGEDPSTQIYVQVTGAKDLVEELNVILEASFTLEQEMKPRFANTAHILATLTAPNGVFNFVDRENDKEQEAINLTTKARDIVQRGLSVKNFDLGDPLLNLEANRFSVFTGYY